MTEPIKLPPMEIFDKGPWVWKGQEFTGAELDAVAFAKYRLAVEQNTAELRAELAAAEYALRSRGYRKSCEISACNCGDQWSHGGNAEARLRELSSELHRSPVDMNGKTLLAGLSELVDRAEKAEAEVERLRAAARQAVKALEGSNCNCFSGCDVCAEWPGWAETADAIRTAMKEPK